MKTKLAAICWLLFAVASALAQGAKYPADVAAIKGASAAWDKAWSAGDCEALALLYTTDAIAMGPNAPAEMGRDVIRASCKKYFSRFREVVRSQVEDVRVSRNLAVARGTEVSTTSPKAGGKTVQYKDKWITVYQRQRDGSWKILWEIYNSNLPVTPSLSSDKVQLLSQQAQFAGGEYIAIPAMSPNQAKGHEHQF